MSGADRRQAVAAAVRRVPGYRAVREAVLPRVRDNATLSDVVWRVFRPDPRLGATPVPFAGGRHVTGPGIDRLPVVAFDLLAVPADLLEEAVEGLAELQRSTLAFRPVLVVSAPVFDLARRHGFVVDLVASPEDWWGEDGDYDGYVARRMVSVRQGFRPWHVVRVRGDGAVEAPDVRLLLAAARAMSSGGDAPEVRACAPTDPDRGGADRG